MTAEQLQAIQRKWLAVGNHGLGNTHQADLSEIAADIQRLVAEVRRLQESCAEITWQYARLCERCRKRGEGYCTLSS